MSQPNVHEALSNGSVDGYKHYEVANHMTGINMGQTLGFGIIMNLGTYQSLTGDQRALMDELGRDFTVEMAGIMARSRIETKARLAERIDGKAVEMLDASTDMREALIEVALADAANWIALTEEWAADVAAKGYPRE
jgi:TRAP-type C4-dicarboxylate transport system substrate-binding protein